MSTQDGGPEVAEKCVICKELATCYYMDNPSCGKVKCEYTMQIGLDYMGEHDGG